MARSGDLVITWNIEVIRVYTRSSSWIPQQPQSRWACVLKWLGASLAECGSEGRCPFLKSTAIFSQSGHHHQKAIFTGTYATYLCIEFPQHSAQWFYLLLLRLTGFPKSAYFKYDESTFFSHHIPITTTEIILTVIWTKARFGNANFILNTPDAWTSYLTTDGELG